MTDTSAHPTGNRVDAAWLREHLEDPEVRVVDGSVHLGFDADGSANIDSARSTYLSEHIPAATFLDISAELGDVSSSLALERFAAAAGAAGLGDGTTVVVYDHVNGIWATRLWWQLRLAGHTDVRVLDGGLAAWKGAGFPLSSGGAEYAPATLALRPRPELISSTDEVEESLSDDQVLLIDALGAKSYAAGHIPGAVNAPFPSLFDDAGRFLAPAELAERFRELGALEPDVQPVTYCGGGIAATAAAFALAEAGRSDVRVYDGSLRAWTADPSRPLESA